MSEKPFRSVNLRKAFAVEGHYVRGNIEYHKLLALRRLSCFTGARLHLSANFRWVMPPEPPRRNVAFSHSERLPQMKNLR